jgi:hypothetical protein
MNMNWYITQELATAHRRDLIALAQGSSRREHSRRWTLPRLTVRWAHAPRPVVARDACQ